MNNHKNEHMKADDGVDKLLGKKVRYPRKYSPEILHAIPRLLNREQYGIEAPLPFIGYDVWHAYEPGFLTQNGMPVTGLLKAIYPSDSKYIVESKSLKLYLNSFNMARYGKDKVSGVKEFCNTVTKDLSSVLQTDVKTNFIDRLPEKAENDFTGYTVLEDTKNAEDTRFNDFFENPALLVKGDKGGEAKYASHLLRSNCKVTFQPDWGSAFIKIKGDCLPETDSLLKYIVSLREENHFHEEICELIYKRLWDLLSPEELMVTCIYTRRGGIDICPVRASNEELLPDALCTIDKVSEKLLRQ